MSEITPDDIRRLRAAITPGEWARFQKTLTDADPLDEGQPLGAASVECITDIEQDGGHMVVTIAPEVLSNADAEFIAAAPGIADAYLALLERLTLAPDGTPKHLRMGLAKNGDGPMLSEDDPDFDHWGCWCGDPVCQWGTKPNGSGA